MRDQNAGVRRRANAHDWVNLGLTGLFGVTLLIVLSLVAAPYLEQPPLVYTRLPIPVDPQPVAPGQPIPLHIERCNRLDHQLYLQPAHTLQNLDTGRSYFLPSMPAVARPGCGSALVTSSIVPDDAPDGRYQLFGVVRVEGTNKSFDVSYSSEPFTVVAP